MTNNQQNFQQQAQARPLFPSSQQQAFNKGGLQPPGPRPPLPGSLPTKLTNKPPLPGTLEFYIKLLLKNILYF